MNIDIILPYKEIYSEDKASAVSLTVKNSMEFSKFNSTIKIYGQFTINPFSNKNFIGIKIKRFFHFGKNRSIFINYFDLNKKYKEKKFITEIHNRPYIFNLAINKIHNKPITLHYHNDPTAMKGSKKIKERKNIINKASAVYFVSNYIKNKFLEGIDGDFDNLYVLPNGIERRLVTKPYKKKEILFIGRLVPEKGAHLFVESIKKIAKKHNDWNFKIIGTSKAGQSKLITKYEKKVIEDFKLINNNTSYLGFISNYEVQEALKSASILVIPSLWDDPFPLTALEGLSNGVAIIASSRGGLTEMLKNKAILLENINSVNLEQSINNFILNSAFLEQYQNKSWNNYIYNQTSISKLQDSIRDKIFNSYYK